MNRIYILVLGIGIPLMQNSLVGQSNVDSKKQGFSMRLWLDNRGVMGILASCYGHLWQQGIGGGIEGMSEDSPKESCRPSDIGGRL